MKINPKRIVLFFLILLLVSINISGVYAAQDQVGSYAALKLGSRGSEVSRLQQTLNSKGFSSGAVDGIFGQITKSAVINFQKANKITIDGIAGKQTQSLLYAVSPTRGATMSRNTDSADMYWLSRIIEAEAGSESYTGKVAVGNVILNRVNSKDFPNTVKGVIFEYFNGIPQFSPVAEGTINNTPSQESVSAAQDAINGTKPFDSSTYFFNPDKSEGKWIVNNKTYVKSIGNHVFYK